MHRFLPTDFADAAAVLSRSDRATAAVTPSVWRRSSTCRKRVVLAPNQTVPLGIRIKLADLTTRRHYAGRHAVDLLVNGIRFAARSVSGGSVPNATDAMARVLTLCHS